MRKTISLWYPILSIRHSSDQTEDLEAYPRDFERDSELCESLGADLIFHPEPKDMYHDPHAYVSIDTLSDTLCGKTRPIHFKGVCTVVSKLFNIVAPDRAYFGQKGCTAACNHPQDGAGFEF